MNFIQRWGRRADAFLGRHTATLNSARALRAAAWCMPLGCGLLSLAMGMDDNWDLRNYHAYNAYAYLNDRVGADLAPGQFQSYFNPALDVFYHLLRKHLTAPAAGFIVGILHGINFFLLTVIARVLLGTLALGDRYRVPLLLAVVGCCSPAFLSELGNSMGDNLTALCVLGALAYLLGHWPRLGQAGGRAPALAALAGLIMGIGVGLKPTNAVYAVALCLALLTGVGGLWRGLRLAFSLGVGVLAGMALTAGFWMWKMWTLFANPFFPQFNGWFRSPLAAPTANMDLHWMPKSVAEALLWPFIFTLDAHRISDLAIRQLIWPVVYLLFLAFAAQAIWRRRNASTAVAAALVAPARFFLIFFVLSYLVWLKMFSIYRYLIPLELLAPIAVWLLLHRVLTAALARRVAAYVLGLILLAVFPFSTWGHSPWSRDGFSASVPAFEQPETSVIFIAQGDPPLSWLAPFFPRQTLFISVGAGFPESPAFLARIDATRAARGGPHYLIATAHSNQKEVTAARLNGLADSLGLTDDSNGCAHLDWLTRHVRLKVEVHTLPATAAASCALQLQARYRMDLEALDRAAVDAAATTLGRYGMAVVAGSCRRYPAFIGKQAYPYQLCRLRDLPPHS